MKIQTVILRFIALEGSKYVSKRDFEMFGTRDITEDSRDIATQHALHKKKCVFFFACGWYKISIPAAQWHCILCFFQDVKFLPVLRGCDLSLERYLQSSRKEE